MQAVLSGDYAKALSIFKSLVEHGNADAQYALGVLYDKGHGVSQDYAKAAYWYRKAAAQGFADAQFSLGLMYAKGQGVHQSGAAAVDWYYKAGIAFLADNNRDGALSALQRIKSLQQLYGATLPNGFLSNKLLAKIYGGTHSSSASGVIPVGSGPRALAITPDGTTLYVANWDDGIVSVISTATNTVVGSPIPVGRMPDALAITPDGTTLYVANANDGTVSVISTATNTVVGLPIPVGGGPDALAITPDGTTLYVANAGDGTVSVIAIGHRTIRSRQEPSGFSQADKRGQHAVAWMQRSEIRGHAIVPSRIRLCSIRATHAHVKCKA